MPTSKPLSDQRIRNHQPSLLKPAPKCPKCRDSFHIFTYGPRGQRIAHRCECLSAKLRDSFLSKIPTTVTPPFRSVKFESLNPCRRSLLIHGNQDVARAMIRGTLGEYSDQLKYDVLDPVSLTGSYVGDSQRTLLDDVIDLDLLIVPMRITICSEKTGQAVIYIAESRHDKGKPTWFLLSELTPHIKASYCGPLLDLLLLRPVSGYRLEGFECSLTTFHASLSPGQNNAIDPDSKVILPSGQRASRVFQAR